MTVSPRRLLITGSRGFVGSVLTQTIRSQYSAEFFELIDFVDPLSGKSADLRDAAAIDRAVAAGQPDVIIHLAGIAAPRDAKKNPEQAWLVNVMGTLHLAQSALRHVPKARFVWAGSSEAYGAAFNRSGKPVLEDAGLEPMSPYGATKAAADTMLRQLSQDGLDVLIFRPFNHTGPGQSSAYVVPAFAEQIAQIEMGLKEPVLHVGNLEARRDFLDVRDVVSAYLNAAMHTDVNRGSVYNLSTGKPILIRSILEILIRMATVPVTFEIDPSRFFPNDIPVASGNPEKIHQELGWKASIPLENTLADVLNYYRAKVRG